MRDIRLLSACQAKSLHYRLYLLRYQPAVGGTTSVGPIGVAARNSRKRSQTFG